VQMLLVFFPANVLLRVPNASAGGAARESVRDTNKPRPGIWRVKASRVAK